MCQRRLNTLWQFNDGEDGYICTVKHPELGSDVAFFRYRMVEDQWTLYFYNGG